MQVNWPLRRRVVAAVVIAVLLPTGPAAAAVPTARVSLLGTPEQDLVRERQQTVRQQQLDAQTQLDETSVEITDLSERLRAARAAVADNQTALAAAQEKLRTARTEETLLVRRLAVAVEVERNAGQAVVAAQDEHGQALADVGRSAREAYVGTQTSETFELLFGSSTFDDFATRTDLLDRLGQLQGDVAAAAQLKGALAASASARRSAARDAVQQLRAAAQQNLERATAAESEQTQLTQEAESLAAAEQALLAEAALRRDEEMVRLDTLEQEAASLQAEMARLAREAAEQAAREQAAREQAAREAAEREAAEREQAARDHAAQDQAVRDRASRDEAARRERPSRSEPAPPAPRADERSPAPSGSGLVRPVSGRVTSSFGWRIHPVYGTRSLHRGTDFGNGCGTPVRAAASGSVASAAPAGSAGNRIILSNGVIGGDSIGTVYMHLQGFAVRTGQTVSQGQVIGYVGTTGASTGCHLHFELYENGDAVDPMSRL